MKWSHFLSVALCATSTSAFATPKRQSAPVGTTTGGDGPYPANYTTDSTLATHTIYLPKSIPAGLKLPVLIWGEGGCISDGLAFQDFLTEIASQGVVVIASGAPEGNGSTTSAMLKTSIDWITKVAGTGKYAQVDVTRIAVAGESCGGLEAYDLANDARVSSIGIFNSGAFSGTAAATFTKPIFYFLGGSTDIAYANGERDYAQVPATTPKWKGNIPTGHGGTYWTPNGGKDGVAAANWVKWVLRGNATAATYFTGTGATTDGWDTTSSSLASLKVTPI